MFIISNNILVYKDSGTDVSGTDYTVYYYYIFPLARAQNGNNATLLAGRQTILIAKYIFVIIVMITRLQ